MVTIVTNDMNANDWWQIEGSIEEKFEIWSSAAPQTNPMEEFSLPGSRYLGTSEGVRRGERFGVDFCCIKKIVNIEKMETRRKETFWEARSAQKNER